MARKTYSLYITRNASDGTRNLVRGSFTGTWAEMKALALEINKAWNDAANRWAGLRFDDLHRPRLYKTAVDRTHGRGVRYIASTFSRSYSDGEWEAHSLVILPAS